MDLQDYKIKNSTICDCGYHFTVHNITELKRISDDKFYGGAIKHVSETNIQIHLGDVDENGGVCDSSQMCINGDLNTFISNSVKGRIE